jgi:hypothetical protein
MKVLLSPVNSLIRLFSRVLDVNKISSDTQKSLLFIFSAGLLALVLFAAMIAGLAVILGIILKTN